MPNRILREGINSSERVNRLDWEEEVFYRRLMSVVDDQGRFEVQLSVLRTRLYPLKLDAVRESKIERHLAASEEARLLRLYEANGKRYLELHDFRQQERSKSKCPDPPPGTPEFTHLLSTCVANDTHVRTQSYAHSDSDAHPKAQAPPAGGIGAEKPPKTAKGVEIPPPLRTPQFLESWREWERHLGEKRVKTTTLADEKQLRECAGWGSDTSVRYIAFAIAKNWRGLYPPKSEGNGTPAPAPSSRRSVIHGEV